MISRLNGTVVFRDTDRVEVETSGGVTYEVEVPLTVLVRLPSSGGMVELRTFQVVTDSSVALYGFVDAHERTLFQRLLTANGVGAKLALAMLSTYDAERLARVLAEKDIAALQQVSGIGKKKAEKIVLDLSDKVADLAITTPSGGPETSSAAQEAVQALIALGYTFTDADQAVRRVMEDGVPDTSEELIRRALAGG